MYTAFSLRGLYWNPASPVKLTWSELDRSNFACARSAVTSLVLLERKETRAQPFFWYRFERNRWKCVGSRAPPSRFGLLGKPFRSFGGDRAKWPMDMKGRLARCLGIFARCEQRSQVWDDASVYLVERFCVSSFSFKSACYWNIGPKEESTNRVLHVCS